MKRFAEVGSAFTLVAPQYTRATIPRRQRLTMGRVIFRVQVARIHKIAFTTLSPLLPILRHVRHLCPSAIPSAPVLSLKKFHGH